MDARSGPTGTRSAPATGGAPNRAGRGTTSQERIDAATADVSHYRVVALADLVKERFGGNPFAARKAINRMKADGLVDRTHPSWDRRAVPTACYFPQHREPGARGRRGGVNGNWTRNSGLGAVRDYRSAQDMRATM